ncbi:hypothetical protein HDU93_002226 [Gonapodya sp. JEL0774]|nr:hypothetical protein HDU93_002226 [Gonapodya sp. JEL0774]
MSSTAQLEEVDSSTTTSEERYILEEKLFEGDSVVVRVGRSPVSNALCLVTPVCSAGDLHRYVVLHGPLPEHLARPIVAAVATGLAWIHHRGVVHRDIKADNIFLRRLPQEEGFEAGRDVVIGDFGETVILPTVLRDRAATTPRLHMAQKLYLESSNYKHKLPRFRSSRIVHGSSDRANLLHSDVGTPGWKAPEVATVTTTQQGYDGKLADSYGLGMLAYWIELLDALLERYTFEPESVWAMVSEDAKTFIRGLLRADPQTRMTVNEARGHAWITGGKDGDVGIGRTGFAVARSNDGKTVPYGLENEPPSRGIVLVHASTFPRHKTTADSSLWDPGTTRVRRAFEDLDMAWSALQDLTTARNWSASEGRNDEMDRRAFPSGNVMAAMGRGQNDQGADLMESKTRNSSSDETSSSRISVGFVEFDISEGTIVGGVRDSVRGWIESAKQARALEKVEEQGPAVGAAVHANLDREGGDDGGQMGNYPLPFED